MSNTEFVNITYYKFVNISDVLVLKQELLNLCLSLSLKGTIILAQEGINSCLVGLEKNIEKFIDHMQQDPRFSDIDFKKSYSSHAPFRKMIVKIKKETIPLGMENIKPAEHSGKYVKPMELKKWLDNKEDLIILDTRNDYEVEIGTFRDAINPMLKEFRHFPEWVRENLGEHKNKKIVTFCTGGIRCEKATEFMHQEGFQDVYQVQGGILKYFEETAKMAPNEDNYYDGDCFVFDQRVAVDKNLNQSKYLVCHHCWRTLTEKDTQHPLYKKESHCSYCQPYYEQKQKNLEKVRKENDSKCLVRRKSRSQKIKANISQEPPKHVLD